MERNENLLVMDNDLEEVRIAECREESNEGLGFMPGIIAGAGLAVAGLFGYKTWKKRKNSKVEAEEDFRLKSVMQAMNNGATPEQIEMLKEILYRE